MTRQPRFPLPVTEKITHLTSRTASLEYAKTPAFQAFLGVKAATGCMNQDQPRSPANGSSQKSMVPPVCKHPRVQIVARDEDTEYVECKECGEVFESSEFKDMAIEENTPAEEA